MLNRGGLFRERYAKGDPSGEGIATTLLVGKGRRASRGREAFPMQRRATTAGREAFPMQRRSTTDEGEDGDETAVRCGRRLCEALKRCKSAVHGGQPSDRDKQKSKRLCVRKRTLDNRQLNMENYGCQAAIFIV